MLCILGMPSAALASCLAFFSFCVSPSVRGVLSLLPVSLFYKSINLSQIATWSEVV